MNGLTQIQVIKDGEATVMFGLDSSGRVWRSRPRRQSPEKYVIKWVLVEESDTPGE